MTATSCAKHSKVSASTLLTLSWRDALHPFFLLSVGWLRGRDVRSPRNARTCHLTVRLSPPWLAGWGTNEALIISILGHRDAAQRRAIRRAYAEAYGEELLRSITDEISGDFEVKRPTNDHFHMRGHLPLRDQPSPDLALSLPLTGL
jgi:hypothetical protein